MKLSEAIRLGSMLHEQIFGSMTERRGGQLVGTCALGSATAAGYGGCTYVDTTCPVCLYELSALEGIVVHLNDVHRWTRERIADWVATVEPAEVAAESPAELSVVSR